MNSLFQMGAALNRLWRFDLSKKPISMNTHTAKVFHECVQQYTTKLVEAESKKDLAGSIEVLSELALLLFTYVERKGLRAVFFKTCDKCFRDIKRVEFIKDLEEEDSEFSSITEGQPEGKKIVPDTTAREEIENILIANKRRLASAKRKLEKLNRLKNKPKKDDGLL